MYQTCRDKNVSSCDASTISTTPSLPRESLDGLRNNGSFKKTFYNHGESSMNGKTANLRSRVSSSLSVCFEFDEPL